jgi:lysozyme family protein
MTFEEIVEGVLHREGGYVNHPDDPGGETKYGIAKRSHPDEDIKNMTMDRAADIYEKDYWKPSKATSLPKSLQECYFDMVVNMGQRRAVKILQEACNSKGCGLGKRYFGTLIRETASHIYARTHNGKIKTIKKKGK